ncbi:hypothetical protein SAY86_017781 [Trapa natans]|uniref:Uncharacterized protein n=1 Tax=Trapa natans TaxID=22666 RepID=A0AAN7M218_TRANT|nr:hypothetical protein SAY86_017781 [Trapa natans]
METWFIVILSLCFAALAKPLLSLISPRRIPPGPISLPFISDLFWVRKSFTDLEQILRGLHAKYGPLVTLRHGGSSTVYIASHSLAHQALVQSGAVFSDRPPVVGIVEKITTANQRQINSAFYGPTWRFLRRNLTAEILHPSRVKSYSSTRRWVLEILLDRLREDGPIRPVGHFQYTMFCLLVLMCFGDRLEEQQIRKVEAVQRGLLMNIWRFEILNFWPRLGKLLFRQRWEDFLRLRSNQEEVLIQLIKARSESRMEKKHAEDGVVCYVDTLLNLELPEEKRKLTEDEMVSLCSEFLNAGTDTTSTALQWIMANITKYPAIQEKLFNEIMTVMSPDKAVVAEEDLQKLPYLKAVVLEGLRRHPPAHFVMTRLVAEDTELGGYLIPRNAKVNFMVAAMGWDPEVWKDPMAFRPDRFLSGNNGGGGVDGFDITGSREIKMMPFGVGRRMCPGYTLALLHLEYFVANLVWRFEWKPVEGDQIDLSEKEAFTVVMKNPLQAILTPRANCERE